MNLKQYNYLVYKHTSPSGKVYIGITYRAPSQRWHNGQGYKSQSRFYNAIKKYGWGNFTHEILYNNLEEQQAKILEISLIRYYKNKNISYNISYGGEGAFGICGPAHHSYGKHRSEEVKKKISQANSGVNHYFYGKHLSEEHKENIRQAKRNIATKIIPILQYTLDGEFVAEYDSISNAARTMNCDESAICKCCRGKRNHVRHFKWKYKYEN